MEQVTLVGKKAMKINPKCLDDFFVIIKEYKHPETLEKYVTVRSLKTNLVYPIQINILDNFDESLYKTFILKESII